MSDPLGPDGHRADDPLIRASLALVFLGVAIAVGISLLMRWIEVGALGESGGRSALATVPLLAPVGAGAVLALCAAILAALGRSTARFVAIVAASLILAPSLAVVVVTEALQAALPTWLEPLITNSDFLSFRAGPGAWLALSVGVVLMVSVTSLGKFASLVENSRTHRVAVVAPVVAFGASVALIALRAQPAVIARVDGVHGSLAGTTAKVGNLAGGNGAIASRAVDRLLGSEFDDSQQVRIVLGDLPVVGLLSFIAVLVLAVAAAFVLLQPRAVWTWLAGTAVGTLLFCHWLVAASVEIGNAVLPDSWLALGDGQVVVAADTSNALRWATLWATLTFGALIASIVISESDPAPGDALDDFVDENSGRNDPTVATEVRW
jgi:hypothetical protein